MLSARLEAGAEPDHFGGVTGHQWSSVISIINDKVLLVLINLMAPYMTLGGTIGFYVWLRH
jgi:hypothetical protein